MQKYANICKYMHKIDKKFAEKKYIIKQEQFWQTYKKYSGNMQEICKKYADICKKYAIIHIKGIICRHMQK